MTREFWKPKLVPSLDPVEFLQDKGEDCYSVGKGKLALHFEGNFTVSGTQETLTVNFNDPELLVLIMLEGNIVRVYHVPYSRLVGLESIHEGDAGSKEITAHYFRN
jgi:hypothetical protein